ncbi:biotin/lipoyl-containing protein [Spiroplasma endosymbiont of Labia minor]|uniref:biotin/lipoyl-containing protein n=1 Tax=Spiroplasma endosymbiont of Labia minor TaxID=3066305 RepID=UPI0030CF9D85
MYNVKFTDLGEGLIEGKVTKIYVKPNQTIKNGQELFEVETDKVTSDIYSPVAGVISKILIKDDQDVKVGDLMIVIDDNLENNNIDDDENASVVGSTPVSDELLPPRN